MNGPYGNGRRLEVVEQLHNVLSIRLEEIDKLCKMITDKGNIKYG